MPETFKPLQIPRSFLADAPATTVNVGLNLLNRRSAAFADFWRSFAEVRQPTELMAIQLNYFTQMVDDYQEAFSEGMSQLSGAADAATHATRRGAAHSA